MARYVKKVWESNALGWTRADRRSCTYASYEPDKLAQRRFRFEDRLTAEMDDTTRLLVDLNQNARAFRDTEALARLALRAESVASSYIEGLRLSPRRILRSELSESWGEPPESHVAAEIVANIRAMTQVIKAVGPEDKITKALLLAGHRELMRSSAESVQPGAIRTSQNWIGGNSFHPCQADFVPPDPEQVPAYLEDLLDFCNQEHLPPIAQAAIAHAQFETIHPFRDGNGRMGRALIHLVLRRRGVTTQVIPPISLALATRPKDYVAGLMSTRYTAAEDADNAMRQWISFFAGSCQRAVLDVRRFEQAILRMQETWLEKVGAVRANSSLAMLMKACVAMPILTVNDAARLIGRSFPATNDAIARLAAAGILKLVIVGKKRHRLFEATDVINLLRRFERQMASPAGNTQIEPPNRPVPSLLT